LLKVLEHTDSGYRLYRKDDTISVINMIKEVKGRIPSLDDIKRNYEVAE
jgi:DNA-binding transcriptional MerR regulator